MAKVKGGDLMLFVGSTSASTKSIAYATNHTLEINAETADVSNKDEGGGDWATQEVKLLSWNASSENLYCTSGAGESFSDLYDLMIAKTPIFAVFSKKSGNATDVPSGGWSSSAPKYTGKVVITSLQLNAQNGEYATFTANFTGVGALTKVNS